MTDGPWRWTTPRYGVPDLEGRAGNEFYRYDTTVLEADHSGECGCRSACTLELNVDSPDAEFIAAARQLVPELVAEVERLRNDNAALRIGQGNAAVLLREAAEQYDRLLRTHEGV